MSGKFSNAAFDRLIQLLIHTSVQSGLMTEAEAAVKIGMFTTALFSLLGSTAIFFETLSAMKMPKNVIESVWSTLATEAYKEFADDDAEEPGPMIN